MDWLVFGVQWLHVLLCILWFGNSLALVAITSPAINRLSIPAQREIGGHLGRRGERVIDVVAPAVIVLGVIRGTLLGPIKSTDFLFATSYGITWMVALVAAVLTFLWSKMVIVPAVRSMDALPLNTDGTPTPELEAAPSRAKVLVTLELIGFLVVCTCMILMRFGA